MSEQPRFCDCYHPDCTTCKIEDIRSQELSATKEKLEELQRTNAEGIEQNKKLWELVGELKEQLKAANQKER